MPDGNHSKLHHDCDQRDEVEEEDERSYDIIVRDRNQDKVYDEEEEEEYTQDPGDQRNQERKEETGGTWTS